MKQVNTWLRIKDPNFQVPIHHEFAKYYLEPISTGVVVEDWQTLLANAEAIAHQRGKGARDEWPFVCTLEENYKDLAWLEICAAHRQLFCYVLRSQKDKSYQGCIYIYPIELFNLDKVSEYEVDFSFWIVQEKFDAGEYEPIYKQLIDWLVDEWGFGKDSIFLRNMQTPESVSEYLSLKLQ